MRQTIQNIYRFINKQHGVAMTKVKLTPINNFGRQEFKPVNETAKLICSWTGRKHVSIRDKKFIEELGLNVVVLEFPEDGVVDS